MTICTQHLFDISAFQFVRRQLWNWTTTTHVRIITSIVFTDDNGTRLHQHILQNRNATCVPSHMEVFTILVTDAKTDCYLSNITWLYDWICYAEKSRSMWWKTNNMGANADRDCNVCEDCQGSKQDMPEAEAYYTHFLCLFLQVCKTLHDCVLCHSLAYNTMKNAGQAADAWLQFLPKAWNLTLHLPGVWFIIKLET
jgi:hypothetical protein